MSDKEKNNSQKQSRAKDVHKSPKKASTFMRTSIKNQRSTSGFVQKANRTRAGQVDRSKLKDISKGSKASQKKIVRFDNSPNSAVNKQGLKTPSKHQDPNHAQILSDLSSEAKPADRSIVEKGFKRADRYNPNLHDPNIKAPRKSLISKKGFKSLIIVLLIIVTGYTLYANISNISLRIASSEAGFSANVPAYVPSGFSFATPIEYKKGQITLNYNGPNEKNFKIVERKSNWDSSSILDNYVKPSGKNYSTVYDRGLTVHIFDDNSATWVNGGIWYVIESDNALNSEQLIKIAIST